MGWGSTVPACLDGLVTALASLDTTVLKGAVVGNSSRTDAIIVGGDDQGSPAVEAKVMLGDAGLQSQRELYVVNGVILVTSGSTDVDPFITRGFELLNGIGAALKADKTLGRAVMAATLAAWHLDLSQTSTGGLLRIPFAVDVEAFTTR